MKKPKNLSKNKKIIIIIILVLVAVITATFIFFKIKKPSQNIENITYTRTVTLSYGSLKDTIVSSGTIESQNTSSVSANGNYQVSKINYNVGDYVEEGDVIIELDKTSVNKQITKLEEQITSAKTALNKAESAYNSAYSKVKSYETTYNNAYANYIAEQESLMNKGCIVSDNGVSGCEENLDNYNSLKQTLKNAEDNLKTIKNATNYDSLKKEYDSAKSTYENLSEGASNDNLSNLYESLEDYELTAKSSGQITSLNAVLGSGVNGTLATIQDTSKLKISVSIDEYDIFKVELGQSATIETDASDIVYEGIVSQISPVASGSMGSSGFEVEIDVTSEDVSKLLIGMSAEVTIIVDEMEENFSVPVDAIETKEDGTKVVYVQNENGDFEQMEVTTGESNGYYIEIFGEGLKEGMKIRASANEDEANVSTDIKDDFSSESGFDFGGFGGGNNMPSNMPSGGGGNMPSGGFPGGN